MDKTTEALVARAEDILALLVKGDLPNDPDEVKLRSGTFRGYLGLCHNLRLPQEHPECALQVIDVVSKLAYAFEWHSGESDFPVEGEDEYFDSNNLYTGSSRLKRIELLEAFIDYLKTQDP